MVGRRTSTDEFQANGRSPKVDTSRQDKMLGVWVWEYALKHTLKVKAPIGHEFPEKSERFPTFSRILYSSESDGSDKSALALHCQGSQH